MNTNDPGTARSEINAFSGGQCSLCERRESGSTGYCVPCGKRYGPVAWADVGSKPRKARRAA